MMLLLTGLVEMNPQLGNSTNIEAAHVQDKSYFFVGNVIPLLLEKANVFFF